VLHAAAAWATDEDIPALFEGLILDAELVTGELLFELFEVIVVVFESQVA
jgi:hypothetical protein